MEDLQYAKNTSWREEKKTVTSCTKPEPEGFGTSLKKRSK